MGIATPAWLRLREPFDHEARSRVLAETLADRLASQSRPVRVLELACGLASGFRFLSPLLPRPQVWHLLDHDRALLAELGPELDRWSPPARQSDNHRAWEGVSVHWRECDIQDLEGIAEPADVVTVQALLDLVSYEWLRDFVAWLTRRSVPLLAGLTVDGRVRWEPADPRDAAVQRAFRSHQLTDRGFGASPGYRAATELEAALSCGGFTVRTCRADWSVDSRDTEMLLEMIDGTAHAAAEMHPDKSFVDQWRADRRSAVDRGALKLTVGHVDMLAWPQGLQ